MAAAQCKPRVRYLSNLSFKVGKPVVLLVVGMALAIQLIGLTQLSPLAVPLLHAAERKGSTTSPSSELSAHASTDQPAPRLCASYRSIYRQSCHDKSDNESNNCEGEAGSRGREKVRTSREQEPSRMHAPLLGFFLACVPP